MVMPENPKFGGTKFLLRTIDDWKGERVFYNIIKEKLNDEHNFVIDA